MNAIERGTNIHVSYREAYAREQRNARIAVFTWVALLLGVSPFLSGGWFTVWVVLLVLTFLGILDYYQKDAVRARAFHRSDREKPL